MQDSRSGPSRPRPKHLGIWVWPRLSAASNRACSSLVRDIWHSERSRLLPVTQGSSGAIDMLGRSLLNPGDVVFMEYPCYMGTYRNFRSLGARIEFIRSDSGGIDVDHLRERVLALNSAGQVLKFVYTIAEFSNPTGARLSNPRRKALLELSSEFDLLVIDDAAYAETSIPPPHRHQPTIHSWVEMPHRIESSA